MEYRWVLLMFVSLFLVSCSKGTKDISKKITRIERAVIDTYTLTPFSITEVDIFESIAKLGYRDTLINTAYLQKLEYEINQLEEVTIEIPNRAFMFSGLVYFDGEKEGKYLSFNGFEGAYYMRFDGKFYHWRQNLADLLYQKLPSRIMETVYDEMR